jgi:beta-lactamase regulating signal transducer with metallopeptidase domain
MTTIHIHIDADTNKHKNNLAFNQIDNLVYIFLILNLLIAAFDFHPIFEKKDTTESLSTENKTANVKNKINSAKNFQNQVTNQTKNHHI